VYVFSIFFSAQSDNKSKVEPVLDDATREILNQKEEVARLKAVADKHPFYKFNGVWSRELQNLVSFRDSEVSPENDADSQGLRYRTMRLSGWLGGA
jgi:hypothetical protein